MLYEYNLYKVWDAHWVIIIMIRYLVKHKNMQLAVAAMISDLAKCTGVLW